MPGIATTRPARRIAGQRSKPAKSRPQNAWRNGGFGTCEAEQAGGPAMATATRGLIVAADEPTHASMPDLVANQRPRRS
ncbi:hypothetical protein [Catenuloplanes atrovinosus]|uniref:Uncharacterized protein n=1 Tax=Catenuloplanes atrovinosus TaxID=137266 RepID=A0AAE3YU92_9ACTN|nr:hypothetical protein [Catenuloplanes atrovinosus]MDR7278514.1 hypothetical protein [Catenuloplanes atrovinosus]